MSIMLQLRAKFYTEVCGATQRKYIQYDPLLSNVQTLTRII